MPFKHCRIAFAAVAIAVGAAQAVFADDLWIATENRGGKVTAIVNYGHPGEREAPDRHKLVELATFGKAPQSLTARVVYGERAHIGVLVVDGLMQPDRSELIAARYDNGIWSKVGDTWFNASRALLPAATESDWSTKFAKALIPGRASTDAYRIVLGHPLQLVPQADPLRVKRGDTLPVLVLYNGKPLVGGQVENADGVTVIAEDKIPRYASGPDGIAQVPITRAGLQLLAIDYSVPSKNPTTEPASLYNATFAFVLP